MRLLLAIVVGITILVVCTRLAYGDSLAGEAAREAGHLIASAAV